LDYKRRIFAEYSKNGPIYIIPHGVDWTAVYLGFPLLFDQ